MIVRPDHFQHLSNSFEAPVRHASFDDSGGKREGVHIYVGYVAPEPYWRNFNEDWDRALAYYHLPHLHTTSFLKSIPVIGGGQKSEDEVYRVLQPFIEVIENRLVWGDGFGVVALTTDDAWKPLGAAERKVVSQPSLDCFESAVELACFSISGSLSASDPLSIQVDEQKNVAILASRYLKLKALPIYSDSLGAICFADDRKLRSIQAADLLAHLVLRQWRASKMENWPLQLARLIDANSSRVQSRIKFHDADALGDLAHKRLRTGSGSH